MNCKSYIRAHADELLESLAALVRIPSVEGVPEEHAPFGREPARALHETLALCEKLGFRTGNMDDRVGWCEYGEGEEMVAVLGHLDVVPAGDGWTETEPFSGEIKNGRIYGRGTMDDKGPMVAAIYALAALKDAGFAPSKRIRPSAVRHQRGDRLRRYVVVRFAWRRAAGVRLHAGRRIPDHQRRKRAFSTALTAESCTRPAITA